MLTAALLDLLSPEEQQAFLEQMNRLLPGVQVKANPAQKCGVQGLHVQVLVNGEEEHSHDHGPVHPTPAVHEHPHEHGHDHEHAHEHPHEHDHEHEHEHHHDHGHEHHHDHEHEHGHDHPHDHEHGHGHHHHATMAWVEHTIQETNLPPEVKEQALNVYRTIAQAEALEGFSKVDMAISIAVENEAVIGRIAGRRMCKCGETYHVSTYDREDCAKCGSRLYQRDDDREEVVRERLRVYDEQTKPLIDFYANRNLLRTVDGSGGVDATFGLVCKVIDGNR